MYVFIFSLDFMKITRFLSKANDCELICSFAISAGVRSSEGVKRDVSFIYSFSFLSFIIVFAHLSQQ